MIPNYLVPLAILVTILIVVAPFPVHGQDCPNLSWRVVSPYPYAKNAYQIIETIQSKYCGEQTINATVVFMDPPEPIVTDWYYATQKISFAINYAAWLNGVEINPSHDAIDSKYRLYWGFDRQTLIQDDVYQRLFWPYNETDPPVQTAHYRTFTQTVKALNDEFVIIDTTGVETRQNSTSLSVNVTPIATQTKEERIMVNSAVVDLRSMSRSQLDTWLKARVHDQPIDYLSSSRTQKPINLKNREK